LLSSYPKFLTEVRENKSVEQITITPNPTQNTIHIKGIVGNTGFFLHDVLGRKVGQFAVDLNGNTSLPSLNPGIYTATFITTSGTRAIRFVKE
jgi:hypothetical protein